MILAILQARVSSSRLPGKVLKPILGMPMLVRQIERIQRAKLIDKLVVATSRHDSDNPIEEICAKYKVDCYRGSLDDVLDRYYQVAELYNPTHIVRVTGDCPLIDPAVIDVVISCHIQGGYDYTSNAVKPTYPDGLDVEVIRYDILKLVWQTASLQSQREHVTLYINQHPQLFRVGSVQNNIDLSMLRWTVDEQRDFELVTNIYEQLYSINSAFTTADVLAYLAENPALRIYNTMYERNEGLRISLKKERSLIDKKRRRSHE